MSGEWIARIVGQTIGGVIILFLFSLLIRIFAFKEKTITNVLIVSTIALGVAATIYSLVSKSEFLYSLIQYAPSAIILAIFDLSSGKRDSQNPKLLESKNDNSDKGVKK